jgi:hypothetical protein
VTIPCDFDLNFEAASDSEEVWGSPERSMEKRSQMEENGLE